MNTPVYNMTLELHKTEIDQVASVRNMLLVDIEDDFDIIARKSLEKRLEQERTYPQT